MSKLKVERIGGLAGFGGGAARLRSSGQVDTSTLSPAEKAAVEKLFRAGGKTAAGPVRDGFRYRITRTLPNGDETIEAPESDVPHPLIHCVKDELT